MYIIYILKYVYFLNVRPGLGVPCFGVHACVRRRFWCLQKKQAFSRLTSTINPLPPPSTTPTTTSSNNTPRSNQSGPPPRPRMADDDDDDDDDKQSLASSSSSATVTGGGGGFASGAVELPRKVYYPTQVCG